MTFKRMFTDVYDSKIHKHLPTFESFVVLKIQVGQRQTSELNVRRQTDTFQLSSIKLRTKQSFLQPDLFG